jgi:simple sugar transport system ATP-binding protein
MTALLSMRGICKRFGNVVANDNIDLDVHAGRIVGLLGENGSGKSTLMRILFGMAAADAGSIVFKQRELSNHNPAAARALGIAMIHQHFMLCDALSVQENVMLGRPQAGRWLRDRGFAGRLRRDSEQLGLPVAPRMRVDSLPLGRRQRVEVLKAVLQDRDRPGWNQTGRESPVPTNLDRGRPDDSQDDFGLGADLLILDEPTSNLAPSEAEHLFAAFRQLRDRGAGIIFISHKMGEILALCDEVVVLRAGRVVERASTSGASRADLAVAMLGREIAPRPERPRAPGMGAVRLRAEGLRTRGFPPSHVPPLDLELRGGEILGIAGVDGNGQTELAELLAGILPASAGRVVLDGNDITRSSVAARRRLGLAYIPADRLHVGLVPAMSIAENLRLRGAVGIDAAAAMAEFAIRAPGPDAPVASLSGGNQQKIVVARELADTPRVLIASQPTWGLDPGAAAFVLARIALLRDAGAAVLFISSDLDEVLDIADRIAVISAGRLVGIVDRADADAARLGLWMSGEAA